MFNSCLDMGLGSLFKMSLLEKELDKIQKSFQLEPFCDSDFVILATVCPGSQKGQLHPKATCERSRGADTNLFSIVTVIGANRMAGGSICVLLGKGSSPDGG